MKEWRANVPAVIGLILLFSLVAWVDSSGWTWEVMVLAPILLIVWACVVMPYLCSKFAGRDNPWEDVRMSWRHGPFLPSCSGCLYAALGGCIGAIAGALVAGLTGFADPGGGAQGMGLLIGALGGGVLGAVLGGVLGVLAGWLIVKAAKSKETAVSNDEKSQAE